MRPNLENSNIFDGIIRRGWKLQKVSLVPADNFPIPVNSPPYIELNPAGAVDVLLPAADGNEGLMFLISNISGSTITIKSSGDVAFTTTIVLLTLESVIVFCTGSATAALGWRAFATGAST